MPETIAVPPVVEESIEVPRSEEGGNGIPPETPSAVPPTETPAEPVVVVETTTPPVEAPKEELFELPDGRKVDGETLAREWKENFYPEYTRKSQELAAAKQPPVNSPQPTQNPYADPEYRPQSYEEIIRVAEERALKTIEEREQAKVDRQKAIESEVVSQLTEIKKADPTLNENALFLHANKYGFRDLKAAHANMKDMSEMAKKVKQATAADIAKRNDPVSAPAGAPTGTQPDPSNFENATEYLRSLKG